MHGEEQSKDAQGSHGDEIHALTPSAVQGHRASELESC